MRPFLEHCGNLVDLGHATGHTKCIAAQFPFAATGHFDITLLRNTLLTHCRSMFQVVQQQHQHQHVAAGSQFFEETKMVSHFHAIFKLLIDMQKVLAAMMFLSLPGPMRCSDASQMQLFSSATSNRNIFYR